MEIQGTIVQVLPLQSGVGKSSGKEWKKQEYVIETNEQYPKKICFSMWGDNVDKHWKLMEIGAQITAHIDIESREYNGRWYTEARAWRVDSQGVAHQAQQGYYPSQQQQGGYQAPAPQEPAGDIYLPF